MSVLAICLAALPVAAQQGTVYSNGPINGTTDAWEINFGILVSDSFNVGSGGSSVGGVSFGAWTFPGDVLENARVLINSGGTVYIDQIVSFTQSSCSNNQYAFNVCTETGSFSPVNLAAGTYLLTLHDAVVNDGDPIYWDENSGPSLAEENMVGTIPSEAFTVLGAPSTSVPEPRGAMLLGSGILGLAGILRRRLF